jgi:gliding motility-associated-like protein
MRIFSFVFLITVFALNSHAQQLYPRKFNFSNFSKDSFFVTDFVASKTSENLKQHPEYGWLPFNAPCQNCTELLDKRSTNKRVYADNEKPNHTYSQKSYLPMHYTDANRNLRTIDFRMKPMGEQGFFCAEAQEIPVQCNMNNHFMQMKTLGGQVKWNNRLRFGFLNFNKEPLSQLIDFSYDDYTIGEDGFRVFNATTSTDIEVFFKQHGAKTNFILYSKPEIPADAKYYTIEDEIELPLNTRLEFSSGDYKYSGSDVWVKDNTGHVLAMFRHPVCRYADEHVFTAEYSLSKKSESTYALRILIPVEKLDCNALRYPFVIDPLVYGVADTGRYMSRGFTPVELYFTSMALGSCDYTMTDTVPGKSKLVTSFVELEDETTSNPNCAQLPGDPYPGCLKREIVHRLESPVCGQSITLLCNGPANIIENCDTPGVLTTDSVTVLNARPVPISLPQYIGCIPPQCDDYYIPFTIHNMDSTCGDQCGDFCAVQNYWRMTVEACTVEGSITRDKPQICAGEPVTFTATPNCGVPPYHYIWFNGNDIDTVFGSPNLTIYPENNVLMFCIVVDTCGMMAQTNTVSVTVISSPPANAGTDVTLCEGGNATIGGNPTSGGGASITWRGENALVESWLSDLNVPNPTVTVPAGIIDTFFYVVRAQDFTCFRTDTVRVFSIPNPNALIDTSGSTRICNGQSVLLSTVGNYSSYRWNTNATTPSTSVTQPGTYFVVVTDANGCTDTSNSITVVSIVLPNITAYPDTTINYGDNVTLYTNIDLTGTQIDSFFWNPSALVSCVACPNPLVAPLTDQFYSVTVYTQGCRLSDSVLVRVVLPNNYFIPNAFTPNGDGNNDDFFLYSQSGVTVTSLKIFNRWGEKVYDNVYPWDGTYKGKPAPAGVYVYVFNLQLFGQNINEKPKGSVTLIR